MLSSSPQNSRQNHQNRRRPHHHNNGQQRPQGNKSRPQHRVNFNQMYDKYITLAKESLRSGDRVAAENHFQHAEHYLRIINERRARTQMRTAQEESQGMENDGEVSAPVTPDSVN